MFKNLKNDNKLEQIHNKASPSRVKIQVLEKGTNTEPIHITTQEDVNSIEEKTNRDIEVEMMETPSIHRSPSNHQTTSRHEEIIY